MLRRLPAIALCVLALAGCAAAPPEPALAQLPWRDAVFDYNADLVPVSRDELFRLDPQLLARLQARSPEGWSTEQRLKHLLATVFGPDGRGIAYTAGHSTTAAQTWQQRRGDCLSLAVLTYSVARALGMDARMQEVPTPVLYDRRGPLDFVNQHVNVLFQRARRNAPDGAGYRDVIVDFEPELASGRAGLALSEDSVLARYRNNIAAEHLAAGRTALAYAHFKAAIQADPAFAATYGNLAVLYRQAGLAVEAEQLLRRALVLADPPDVPLHALHQLLLEQGRTAEAAGYAVQLQARQARDPYHWIALGSRHLEAGEVRQAIAALERAQAMAHGFAEVHRHLALAYWRAGEPVRANEQLAVLAAIAGGDAWVSALSRKFNPSAR